MSYNYNHYTFIYLEGEGGIGKSTIVRNAMENNKNNENCVIFSIPEDNARLMEYTDEEGTPYMLLLKQNPDKYRLKFNEIYLEE
jgi:hypothetical protein